MSKNYDNWERLVRAVLRREEFRELCLLSSPSSSGSPSSSESPIHVSDMMINHTESTTMVALVKNEAELESPSTDMDAELLDLVCHMSHILETGLDSHTLSILIALCEMDINPESLAAVVKELRREPHMITQESPN